MKPRKLVERVRHGARQNVAFEDFVRLVEAFGFRRKRISGSHQLFSHPSCDEDLNLQPYDGSAKPYQIVQFLRLVERYNLEIGEDDE